MNVPDNRQSGFSLIELMMSTALLAFFTGLLMSLENDATRSHTFVNGYADDLRDVQLVLRSIERDLRCAHRVEVDERRLAVQLGDQHRTYLVLPDDGLCTTTGGVDVRQRARCVRALDVRQSGDLVTVTLTLRSRSRRDPGRHAQPLRIQSTVQLRTRSPT